MPIEKLIPQYLNQDEDERLVKPYELIDALNVRVSNEDNGNQGILKNIEGTTAVPARTPADTIPASGTNRVIGAVANDAGKCVYFFLYNSGGDHGIYRYNVSNDNYEKLYEDAVLNFEYNGFVKADVVINQYQEDLLYFTDNRNEPRKINATRAGLNQYDSEFNDGTDYVKELYLTACKRPPQAPVTFQFVNDPVVTTNNLKEGCFQFACQYVYDDGEVSAIGVYSSLAVSGTHLAYNTTTKSFFQNENNAIDLTIPNSDGPVVKVRVLARRNNAGAFYQIAELDNNQADTQVFRWRNDGVYPIVSDSEANKPFDSLPRRAGTQVITNNRLLYGNYIEGFDPVTTDSIQYPVYYPGGEEFLSNISGSIDESLGNFDGSDSSYAQVFGDQRSIFNPDYDGADYDDGSDAAYEINPEYNDSSFLSSLLIDIDLSEVQDSGGATTFAYYFDLSIGEIAWKAFDTESNAQFTSGTAYTLVPISFKDENGDAVGTGTYTDGLRLNMPSKTSGTEQELADRNSGFRNLRVENNLIFSGTVDVEGWTTKYELGTILRDNILGATSSVGVRPNATPSEQTNVFGNELTNGVTTEARITDADGSLPDFASDDGGYAVSSKLLLWMEGSVSFTLDSAIVTDNSVKFKIVRSGFDLRCTHAMSISRSTFSQAGSLIPHPLVLNMNQYGNTFTSTLDFQNREDGLYTIALWQGNQIDVQYSNQNTVANSETYQNGNVVNGIDGSISGGGYINSAARNVSADIRFSSELLLSNASSFKSGARHDFGIVYYDHRNRPSPVYKIGSINTERFGNRGARRNGRTEVDIKLFHEPPPYASYWAPVYTKNTSYDAFLQVAIGEAALPRKTSFNNVLSGTSGGGTQRVIGGLKTSIDETIFLSMRTLEGKNNSYKELKGGQIDYKYQEGDKLRIMQYSDVDDIFRPYYEFVITGYNYFIDNDENPIQLARNSTGTEEEIADKEAYRRTGWFLSIRDDKVPGFSASDVALGSDFFSQRCVIEIIRPKKNTDTPLYYEIGQQREIVESGGQRTHGGDRSNTSAETFSYVPTSSSSFDSLSRLYVGDRVSHASLNAAGSAIITGVQPSEILGYSYTVSDTTPITVPQNPVTYINASVVSTIGVSDGIWPGVITLTEGDVYLRVREQLTQPESTYTVNATGASFRYDATDPESQVYTNYLIESESVSDFFDSKATAIGRPHLENTEQVQITRSSSVTYSEPFALDSSRLSLSSFNPLFFPYKDFPTKYGQVTYLNDGGEAAYVMQEKRVCLQPISRTLIESAGDGQLVTSTNVMGTETYFSGMFGPGRNPESVSARFGKTYFADVESGKVIELSRNGLVPISDKSMSSYFKSTFASAIDTETSPRIPSGIDPDNDEYVLSIFQLLTNNILINDGELDEEVIGTVPAVSTGLTYADGKLSPVFETSGITTWGRDQSRWEDATLNDLNWGDKGLGTIVLDRLNERDGVFVSPTERESGGTITVDIVTSDLRFIGLASLSLLDWSIDLPSTLVQVGATVNDDVDETLVVETNTASVTNTLAYSTTKELWLTRYSFTPELYANVHNRFLSFYNGQIYNHNTNDLRNNFYGNQYNSTATLVSKADPSMIKVFNALSLEGNDTWAATISNTEQTTDITEAMYEEREGMYYSVIPKDITANSTNNTSHKVVLGEVESVGGQTLNQITFTSRVSNLPFSLGDTIYILGSDSETSQGVTVTSILNRKTIQVSGSYTSGTGVTLMAVSSSAINGDKMRDYYAEITLTNNSTGAVELFAVNTNYTPSPFHNDQSQKQ